MPALNLSTLIPLAVVALVVYLLQRSGMQLWHAFVCLVLGVVLAGSVFGPRHLQRPVAAQRRPSPLKGTELMITQPRRRALTAPAHGSSDGTAAGNSPSRPR